MKYCPTRKMIPELPYRGVLEQLVSLAIDENVRIYLVGGSVRDLLLGKKVEDLDFAVIGDAFAFARRFANLADASFVPLDAEHGTARVAFRRNIPGTCPYIDFSSIRGEDIISDLAERDFTVNAMAVDLSQMVNSQEPAVIDPHGSIEDLRDGLIRVVSTQGIEDDPLRMLRAYRFAATLGFAVHEATAALIRNSVSLLNSVAAERIRDEIFKILEVDGCICYIRAMDDIGLLEQIFPEISPMKGMEQNEYHHLDVWGHSLLSLELLEEDPVPHSLKDYLSEVEDYLEHEPVKGRARKPLLKLVALLHDVGKPVSRFVDGSGRIRFFDHNLAGVETIGNIGRRLKLASREISSLREMVKDHMYPLGLCVFLRQPRGKKAKIRAMRRFIQQAGDDWLAIVLLSLADLRATQGPWRRADDEEKLIQVIGEIADIYFQEAQSPLPKLVTGSDLMKEFALPASPTIGKLLQQVRKAQIEGLIKTRAEAIEMVREILLGN